MMQAKHRIADAVQGRRNDVLAIGFFGMAIGSLTLGLGHLVEFPEQDHVGIAVIVLLCGGLGPLLTGIALIRNHELLCGIGLAAYGSFWMAICTAQLIGVGMDFPLRPVLYRQVNVVYFVGSVGMAYLTAYRSTTLCLLSSMIAATCFLTVLASLGLLTETPPGFGHIIVGLMALYHAVGSVTLAFADQALVPLGSPLLPRRVSPIRTVL